jgi:steroid 5-alpha reductase family enzyme
MNAILHVARDSALFLWYYVTAWFALSVALKRNDVADIAWGLGPVLLAWWLAFLGPGANPVVWPVAILVFIWGVRLAWHIARRDFAPGRGEDPRYAAWRREWKAFYVRSYLQVFLLQGALMLLVCTPIVVIAAAPAGGIPAVAIAGAVVWVLGFVVESTADRQLTEFLTLPKEERGPIMDRGLWSWSRHPNYFGESLMWWGIGIISVGVWWPLGLLGLIGPVTITVLLVFVSGIPLVERRHAGEPAWEEYKARTSAFVPMPPRKH